MKRFGPVVVLLFILMLLLRGSTAADVGIDAQTNALRATNGLPALTTAADLTAIAEQRAFQIAQPGGYHHEYWYSGSFCWRGLGENLAYFIPAPADTSTYFVGAWAASAPHLANMLGDYTEQGSAVYLAPDGGAYAAQVFRKPCAPTPAPAPPPQPSTPVPPIEQIPTRVPATVQTPAALPDTAMRSPCQTSRTLRPLLNRMTVISSPF